MTTMHSSVDFVWASERGCVVSAMVGCGAFDGATGRVRLFDAASGIDDVRRADFWID